MKWRLNVCRVLQDLMSAGESSMFVVPRPRMLVEQVAFALWEQSAVGRRMIAEAEPEQLSGSGRSGMQASMTS